MRQPLRPVALLLAVLAGAVACGPASTATGRLPVVATFYPLAEFAGAIGGEAVAVRTLVPTGTEPHDYEPTPGDVAAVAGARVFVYNGAGLEPWVDRLLGEVPAGGTVNASEGLPAAGDPHVWLDPVLAQRQADAILAGLVRADPARRDVYEANAARLRGELQDLHDRYQRGLTACARRAFITTHAAFGHLAARYRLEMIPISGVVPEADPSPRRLRALVDLARRRGISVVYVEPLTSPRAAQTLAREIGGRVLTLNPLEGLTSAEQAAGKSYIEVMDENLANLRQGLDCE